MLAEHLKCGSVRREETVQFADLRHDRDLCPRFATQVRTMLDVYKAYAQEVHDIQSFRDDGIDVLLRYEDEEELQRVAGIQIKSEDEFRKWESKKLPLIQILKGQHATAVSNVRVDEFYIILCVDAVRHQERIRTLCSELKNFRPCEIIEPEQALNFYRMESMEIWSRTVRLLCAKDRVFETATKEMDTKEPDTVFFLITLVCQALGESYAVDDERMFDIWSDWEDFSGEQSGPTERISDILHELESAGILEHIGGSSYTLQVSQLTPALCALYFDLKVRAIEPSADLKEQILALIELKGRLEEGGADNA